MPGVSSTTDYELIVVVINEGEISIDVAGTGQTITNIGCVSEADILKAESRPYLDYNQMKGLVGGDFVSGLMNWARKGANVVHKATELGSKASSALRSIGLGEGGELIGSGQGGALARKASLKDRLR